MPRQYEKLLRLCAHLHLSPAEVLSEGLDLLYDKTWKPGREYVHEINVAGGEAQGKLNKALRAFHDARAFYTELLSAAFLAKFPGLEPDECEIVEEWGTGNVTITVRKTAPG